MDTSQRLSDLEAILSEYITQNTLAQRRFEAESKQFREEMLAFKEEIRRDTQALKDEMKAFKDEMKVFKDEMESFRVRIENNIKENNKQWGALANKLGTIVEDLIFPASRPVIESVFGVTIQQIGMRIVRQNAKMKEEFDVRI